MEECTILNKVVREGLNEIVAFEPRFKSLSHLDSCTLGKKKKKSLSHEANWKNSLPGNSMDKGPAVETCLLCSVFSKEAYVAGAEEEMGRRI